VPRAIAPLVPLAWEEVLGDAVLAAVVPDLAGRAERCVEPAGVAALSMLTDRLALATAGSYRFRVVAVRAAMVNALALPGGRIVVFDGLIEAAESPDEIAGVLAHEIAHSMHRHPTQAVLRALGIEVLLKVAAGGSDLLEGAGRAAAFLAQMSYSREAEAEADAGAAEILTAAGISSGGLASFFRRLAEKRTDKHLPTYLDSHPPLEERAVRAATSTRAGDRGLDEDRWSDLRGICRAVAPLAVD
jgi:predicted Zn-dependent protease